MSVRALIVAIAVVLSLPASASAALLGSADSDAGNPEIAASMGARTSRLILNPNRPIESYDDSIAARREAGLRPQLVIGGLTAGGVIDSGRLAAYAVAAWRRWPDVFSVSLINEPELSGYAARPCEFRKTFNIAYRALKAAGMPLVLFGEWSPHSTLARTSDVIQCGSVTADGFAWHAYDWSTAYAGRITNLRAISAYLGGARPRLHTPRGFSLPMFVTEYGQLTRGPNAATEALAAFRWRRALALVERYGVKEIVAYQITPSGDDSGWDSSLIDADGRKRQAFHAIAGV